MTDFRDYTEDWCRTEADGDETHIEFLVTEGKGVWVEVALMHRIMAALGFTRCPEV